MSIPTDPEVDHLVNETRIGVLVSESTLVYLSKYLNFLCRTMLIGNKPEPLFGVVTKYKQEHIFPTSCIKFSVLCFLLNYCVAFFRSMMGLVTALFSPTMNLKQKFNFSNLMV